METAMSIIAEDFTEEAKIVWEALNSKQREVIQAGYPIKKARNDLICNLRAAKVEVQILAEISGLSRQTISKILYHEAEPNKATLEALKADLKKIQKAVGRFGAHIARLEKLQNN